MSPPSQNPPSCADELSDGLSVTAAREQIQRCIRPIIQTETVALMHALDRVLASPIRAPFALPGSDLAAMDGYALATGLAPAGPGQRARVVGESRAGRPFARHIGSGQCVRILTGAVIPVGADSVIMQEHVTCDGPYVEFNRPIDVAQNIRRAGEDIREAQEVLPAGRRLTPSDLGVIASLGIGNVTVYRLPRVAFFSTGDELYPVGKPLPAGGIYDSNRYTLLGALTRLGVQCMDMGNLQDDRASVCTALQTAAETADAVISTGGASVGDADFVVEALRDRGQIEFWKVAMKPGRPLVFGTVGSAYFFGLPGNPVSVLATFYQFVHPALRQLMGETVVQPLTWHARTTTPIRKKPGRMEFQRGILTIAEDGEALVCTTGSQSSGMLHSMSAANCFIILPPEVGNLPSGTTVIVQPFAGLI